MSRLETFTVQDEDDYQKRVLENPGHLTTQAIREVLMSGNNWLEWYSGVLYILTTCALQMLVKICFFNVYCTIGEKRNKKQEYWSKLKQNGMLRHSSGGEVIFFFAVLYCSLPELNTLFVLLTWNYCLLALPSYSRKKNKFFDTKQCETLINCVIFGLMRVKPLFWV